ncbi:MAG: hypothetical protein P4L99_11810 [Chthoniobacter sp.]|nr:hypothetical protein [Chthoniobacter sp.]
MSEASKGEEHGPFAAAPFRLESPDPPRPFEPLLSSKLAGSFVLPAPFQYKVVVHDYVGAGVRLDFPLGPVRIDYGIPLQKDGFGGRFNYNMDSPGPGYREQRAMPLHPAFPAGRANASDTIRF